MDFITLNQLLEVFKDKLLEIGYKVEFYQNLTYNDSNSLKYSYKLRLEQALSDEEKTKTELELVQLYTMQVIKILEDAFNINSLYNYYHCNTTFNNEYLDPNSNIWGMVFEGKNPAIFIEAYIIINKNIASEYKDKVLNQGVLLGSRPLKS